jgi:hypothetical protein
MPTSTSTMFVCAGLVLGALGVGGHYLTNRQTSWNVTNAKPLFARSVEEAEFPASRWPAARLDVPYYGPMVELLTLGASAGGTATADQSAQQGHTGTERQTPRPSSEAKEIRKQQKQARRPKEKRQNDDAATEADAREAYAREVPERNQRRGPTHRRDDYDEADRTTRRSRSRQPELDEAADRRREESRRQQSRDRSFTRDDRGERERQDRRAPENREAGFTPFRMFGIFEQR